MSFNPPNLDTDFSGTGVKSKLEGNFTSIEQALIDISNELPSIQGSQVGASNLTWVERALRPEGVVGHDSFVAFFGTDQDRLTILHLQEGDVSSCVIASNYHETSSSFSELFSTIIPIDGTYTVLFGVDSTGAPSMNMRIVVEDTDNDLDLPIWAFEVTRSGSNWTVTGLRRRCEVLMDRGAFTRAYAADWPFVFELKGTIGTGTGRRACGFIAPWDLEVRGAYLRLQTSPTQTDGVEIEIRANTDNDTTEENVLSGAAEFHFGQNGVVDQLSALSPPAQVRAGSWVYAHVTVAEGSAVASDLSVTVLTRRLSHVIYR
jgi:hypothetical protein